MTMGMVNARGVASFTSLLRRFARALLARLLPGWWLPGECPVANTLRAGLIEGEIGPWPTDAAWAKRLDYQFTYWILDNAIGLRMMSPESIFLRCDGCLRIRSSRHMVRRYVDRDGMPQVTGACRCGSNRSTNSVGDMSTLRVLWNVARGW